ncbi:multidrug efflux MFS transporter [Patescibacteria group bacterium]|nr:multidrug efflux MFS transporter [Patescibacteria group bacterium]
MSTERSLAQNTQDSSADRSLRWWVLVTVILGTFLGRLDQTIVNLALPKIIIDFNISVSAAGWIATAYILANAVFVPVWGKLGDTIGRKKVYVMGFIGFLFGSALAGFAWNLTSMIGFRILQAIAGSADYPTAMAILTITFTDMKERAQVLGLWSSSFAAASVFGPLIGGFLIDSFGWRSIFLVNIPVGLLGLFMALKFIDESVSDNESHYFDWWGSLTLGGSLATLVLVLDQGATWGWLSTNSVLCYASSILLFLAFLYVEQRAPEPIIDLKFFKINAFVTTLVNSFIVFMGMMGSVFLIPIFAETFLGFNATQTGYLFMPMAFAIMIAAPLGGSLTGKVQSRFVIMGSTLVAAFGVYLFSYLDPRSSALAIIVPLAIMAFGIGFGMAPRTNIVASSVPPQEIGSASAILALVRNIAGAFGIALFGTLLTTTTGQNVLRIAQNSQLNLMTPETYKQFIGLIILKAQVSAYGTVFAVAAALLVVGAISSLWIRVEKEEKGEDLFME